jgi:exosortase
VVRSTEWVAALLVLVGVLTFAYAGLFQYSFTQWLKPDYSHGFLVPVFTVYLAWHWREWAPSRLRWPEPWGLAFLAGGSALFVVAGKLNIAKEWLQGLSLVVNLCGATLLLGGWHALRWLAPALAFLMFMFPLPGKVEHALGWQLQKVAAMASEFTLQTIGYPTYREGVVLYVKDHALEVEKACSGLSMLLTFAALSTGMALLVKRPWFDRVLILVSAVPVAILSNVIRIALTGVLYNEGGKELGDRVFHDFAGWMMMPIALGVLWAELKVLDWVWVDAGGRASREEMMRASASPAYLIMTALPPEKGGAAAPAAAPAPKAPAPVPPKGASR